VVVRPAAELGAAAGVLLAKDKRTQVLATNLVPALANNNEWASLGNGTYTPLCLSWVVTSGTTHTLQYIKLSLTAHKWSKISAAELGTC
jgi:hypothetical protein